MEKIFLLVLGFLLLTGTIVVSTIAMRNRVQHGFEAKVLLLKDGLVIKEVDTAPLLSALSEELSFDEIRIEITEGDGKFAYLLEFMKGDGSILNSNKWIPLNGLSKTIRVSEILYFLEGSSALSVHIAMIKDGKIVDQRSTDWITIERIEVSQDGTEAVSNGVEPGNSNVPIPNDEGNFNYDEDDSVCSPQRMRDPTPRPRPPEFPELPEIFPTPVWNLTVPSQGGPSSGGGEGGGGGGCVWRLRWQKNATGNIRINCGERWVSWYGGYINREWLNAVSISYTLIEQAGGETYYETWLIPPGQISYYARRCNGTDWIRVDIDGVRIAEGLPWDEIDEINGELAVGAPDRLLVSAPGTPGIGSILDFLARHSTVITLGSFFPYGVAIPVPILLGLALILLIFYFVGEER